jgi:hypothetical protein
MVSIGYVDSEFKGREKIDREIFACYATRMKTRAELLANITLWSEEEFGQAELGNLARTKRLVMMAQTAANSPGGKIAEVFKDSASRQAAYKFVENEHVDPKKICLVRHIACAERCKGESFVFVPVDGSSLSITDPDLLKEGIGPVGTRGKKGRGLEVMNAIAVRSDGVPLGMSGQVFWARSEKKDKRNKRKRKLKEKETRYWFEAIEQTLEAFRLAQCECTPWFQLDRGGDFREMLSWAAITDAFATIRAAQDRRVLDEETKYLWETVDSQQPLGHYTIDLPAGHGRKARKACMEIRSTEVTLRIRDAWLKKTGKPARLYAVQTKEVGTCPDGEEPVEWLMLTNYAVSTFEDARLVVFGYTQRWRVEEFHKTWKSVCGIEDTQLEEGAHIVRWAVILAAVAMRVERLKYLARATPDAPASEELSQLEIDAIIGLKKPKGFNLGDMPTIGLAVRWIADLGGYTGRSSGGPPGSIVIGRGLMWIAPAIEYATNMSKKLDQCSAGGRGRG